MRTKMLMAVLMGTVMVAGTVNADYVVYKSKSTVNTYTAGATKATKLIVETYNVFQANAGIPVAINQAEPNTVPQRIVVFKPAKGETAYNKTTAKKATNLMLSPRVQNDAGIFKSVSFGYYVGQDSNLVINKYEPYFGSWYLTVLNLALNGAGNVTLSQFVDNEYGEQYMGMLKNGEVKSYSGFLGYVNPTNPDAMNAGQDVKGKLSLFKIKNFPTNSMNDAVDAVVTYLAGKNYITTWTTNPPN